MEFAKTQKVMQRSMKVLVTGASGFVASHLLPELRAAGFSVRAASRKKLSVEGVEWFECPELSGSADWREALDGISAVVHLAGRAHVPSETGGMDVEKIYQRINAGGTSALARQAAGAGVKHFLFMSSCHAVASESGTALSESTVPLPVTAYGRSKLAAEAAVRLAFDEANGRCTIIRPPLVYGPGNLANFARLIEWVRSGVPLPLGGIRNRRSFLGVGNLVDFVMACLARPPEANRIFMPSDDEDVSTPELIRQLADRLERKAVLVSLPESVLACCTRLPGLGMLKKLTASLFIDQTHIRTGLGWHPPSSLRDGLAFLSPKSGAGSS